ncbi:dynamin family protein [Streptomyces daliensis]
MSSENARTGGFPGEGDEERDVEAGVQGTSAAGEPEPDSEPSAGGGAVTVPDEASADASVHGRSWNDGLIARRATLGPATAARRAEARHERERERELERERNRQREQEARGPGDPVSREAPMAVTGRTADSRRDPYDRDAYGRDAYVRGPQRPGPGSGPRPGSHPGDDALRQRLGALRELIGLSRARVEGRELAEAGRVLDEAGARGRLPRAYTTVAIAGATGSGKSSLFNALAEGRFSETGMRRPTTALPVACTWEAEEAGGADGLLDRLGIAPDVRHRATDRTVPEHGRPAPGPQAERETDSTSTDLASTDPASTDAANRGAARTDTAPATPLDGLVLIDLPDHDSVAEGHREQVDKLLRLVDAVVWVVDPEKYADAVLHERYLRPLAGYAEVTFVVLNQTDRLPGEATGTVLDDLRRLLDEDGMALGEHGEPGARVLATSALTGDGVAELRAELADFVATRNAPVLRLSADVDGAVERLRPVYADPAPGPGSGLAPVTGAAGVECAQEPVGLTERVREDFEDRLASAVGATAAGQAAERAWLRHAERSCGTSWSRLLRRYRAGAEAGARRNGDVAVPSVPSGSTDGGVVHGADEEADGEADPPRPGPSVARPVVAQAVRELSERASAGLPEAWALTVRDAAWRGAEALPEALDEAVREEAPERVGAEDSGCSGADFAPAAGGPRPRPPWWTAATTAQGLLTALQLLGVLWLLAAMAGLSDGAGWLPVLLMAGGSLGGPLLAWGCRTAARGPARAYGLEEERRLRRLAAGCGRTRVLEPVAAELLRYREVREQYVIAAGDRVGI